MDKFATLEPIRLYASAASTGARLLSRGSAGTATLHLIGRLPIDLHILVLSYTAIPDIPSYGRCSRAIANLARDERVWEAKWKALSVDRHGLKPVLDELESRSKVQAGVSRAGAPPTISVDIIDDEFGDFASGDTMAPSAEEMGDFVGGFAASPIPVDQVSKPTFRSMYIRAHNLLKPYTINLTSPPHLILSALFPPPAPSVDLQSRTIRLLGLFLSAQVQPLRTWEILYSSLRAAIDRFDANLLAAFEVADGNGDEAEMREAAYASWEVWDGRGEWEMGKVWAEKREIFYEHGQWDPLKNFTKDERLDFDAMDDFMTHVLSDLREHGSRAIRVFPPQSQVLLAFSDRLAVEVVGEYIIPLLTRAREISNESFLKATAACFKVAWRMVDTMVQVAKENSRDQADSVAISLTQAEDVVYRMFEPNMDEYLDEEVESVKQEFEVICRDWEKKISRHANSSLGTPQTARFLGSHNPAQMKRNVLASFTSVLLLPVTIVPRTVGAVLTTGGTAAAQGIAMLNPQRWGGTSQGAGGGQAAGGRYTRDFEKNGVTVFEAGGDEDEILNEKDNASITRSSLSSSSQITLDVPVLSTAGTSLRSSPPSRSITPNPSFEHLQLLLSLDVALELIHADRESLKRTETFAGYPGRCGHRVRDTIEEIFILLLQTMGERHICPGFDRATEEMRTYKPADHNETTSVAPLMQFFELVHIGDMIQSMVQVYFDKELAPHIDRTDFLNGVVREKKRFENMLDDSVAAGLNAGTEVLMAEVEHIMLTLTKPREYYPPEDGTLDLGPTKGCTEAIKCLETHCNLLKGSTSKEVLEVFYQEVGIRLLAILQKHLKRQIISLPGGFQVIADLNAYYSFIASLRVPAITAEFSHLKMLGHVYVVEDAKDLAQIVRDVTRYGGAYRPEDIYEFIQRRSDWKKIEKTVDQTMYNLSFKEDCVVA